MANKSLQITKLESYAISHCIDLHVKDNTRCPYRKPLTSVLRKISVDGSNLLKCGVKGEREEQLDVQLAGCSVAALGGTKRVAKKGDFGWSSSYQDVLDLRIRYDALRKIAHEISEYCNRAIPDRNKLFDILDKLL